MEAMREETQAEEQQIVQERGQSEGRLAALGPTGGTLRYNAIAHISFANR